VWLRLPDGSSKRLRQVSRGLLGEMGAFTGEPRSAAAITDTPAVLRRLTLDQLKYLERAHPSTALALGHLVIRILAERLAHSAKQARALSSDEGS